MYSAGGQFKPFGELAADALVSVGANHKIDLSLSEATEAIRPILSCEPHIDVIPGLERLRNAGYRLVTLTNSSSDGLLEPQMQNAGPCIDFVRGTHLSVEEFGIYKPHLDCLPKGR